ncbi:hypothetical protein K1T71_011311 [Dendrolimus kikuchii]|uniref:Uncharacterized protein n=1 Tax=Dendrolimus kikuchii TaxID=765133 RepID=A0ACC1CNE5_9NEOP|nr:hypothetical protein K1T71_011311 [Dendrolimus kikuchii]
MDSIPDHPILKFHSDTLVVVRKKYNLDKPGDMDKAIDILEEWIKQQDHFTVRKFSREYLERSIITLKGSIERAKIQIDSLCTMRTLLPQFFEKSNPKEEFPLLSKILVQALLPKLTEDHYRIYMPTLIRNGVDSKTLFLGYQHAVLMCEYFKHFDYCDGLIVFTDMRNLDLVELIRAVNITETNQIFSIIMKSYQCRVKAIHILSESKAIDILLAFLRQMFTKKLMDRIRVHKTIECVHAFIPKEILPCDYGGDEKTYLDICADWLDILSAEKSVALMKEMTNARTDESLRQIDKFNDQYLGMAGTFRSLTVD